VIEHATFECGIIGNCVDPGMLIGIDAEVFLCGECGAERRIEIAEHERGADVGFITECAGASHSTGIDGKEMTYRHELFFVIDLII